MSPVARRAVRSSAEGVLFAAIIVAAMLLTGLVSGPRESVKDELAGTLDELRASFTNDAGSVSALNVWLASELSRELERYLSSTGMSFGDLRDNPDALSDIQRDVLPRLLFAMAATKCSGSYFFLFTTANSSSAPDAASGIYLKFDSILSQVTINRTISLFRGDPTVSRERGVALHGSWEMQCDGEMAEELRRAALLGGERPKLRPKPYFLTSPLSLPDTWESARLWGAPLIDRSSGQVIGVCGYEMSDIYFLHLYPRTGSAILGLFDDEGPISEMTIDGTDYVRADTPISVGSGEFARSFRLAAMMPHSVADGIERRTAAGIALAFAAMALLISGALFVARYMITRSVSISLKEILDRSEARSPAAVPEIDDLWAFLGALDQQRAAELEGLGEELSPGSWMQPNTGLTPDGAESDMGVSSSPSSTSLEDFAERLSSLTEREREVFNLYLEGRDVRSIGEELHITQHTIKFHNRNIYSKLGVSSKREMMKLVQMLGDQSAPGEPNPPEKG